MNHSFAKCYLTSAYTYLMSPSALIFTNYPNFSYNLIIGSYCSICVFIRFLSISGSSSSLFTPYALSYARIPTRLIIVS